MEYTRDHFVEMLRKAGFAEVADEAERALPDPVEDRRIAAFLAPHGITLNELVSRMGGTL
ncbi:hypothetical protein ACFZAU_03900 [Streptomyces sp. NPDC008238]